MFIICKKWTVSSLHALCLNNDFSGTDFGDECSLLRCRPETLPHSLSAMTPELTPMSHYRPKSYQGTYFEPHVTLRLTQSWSKLRQILFYKVLIGDFVSEKLLVGYKYLNRSHFTSVRFTIKLTIFINFSFPKVLLTTQFARSI